MANLPKLELKLNESAQVRLLRDKCYEGENGFGKYFLYNVQHDNAEKSFFAPATIHEQIQRHGLKTGAEFILRKIGVQNGKKVNAELSFEPVHAEEESVPQPPPPTNGAVKPDAFKQIMQQSLQDAIDITKAVNTIPWQNEDIRSLSSCLFIARTKAL